MTIPHLTPIVTKLGFNCLQIKNTQVFFNSYLFYTVTKFIFTLLSRLFHLVLVHWSDDFDVFVSLYDTGPLCRPFAPLYSSEQYDPELKSPDGSRVIITSRCFTYYLDTTKILPTNAIQYSYNYNKYLLSLENSTLIHNYRSYLPILLRILITITIHTYFNIYIYITL